MTDMQRVALRRTKKANALTDPKPNFVSLVKAGANMTPFKNVVRHDGMSEEQAMHINAVRADDHEIAQITFKGDAFAKQSAVKAWLEEGGYTDFEIAEDDGFFKVVGRADLTDVREIEAEGGITISVGRIPVETQKEEVSEEAAAHSTTAVVATKAEGEEDGTSEEAGEAAGTEAAAEEAPVAKEEDADGVVAEAPEGEEAPAAVEAEEAPVAKTVDELLQEGMALLGSAGVELPAQKNIYTVQNIGEVLYTLAWLAKADYSDLSDASVSMIKQAAQSLMGALVEAMNDTIDGFVSAFKAEEVAEPAAPEGEAATETDEEPVAKAEGTTEEEAAPEGDADEITSLKEQIAALTAKVESLTKPEETPSQKGEGQPVARQTRKGADVDEAAPSSTTQKTEATASIDELRQRSMLGISTRPRT